MKPSTSTDQDECSVTSKDTDAEQRGATHSNPRTHRRATQRATRRLAHQTPRARTGPQGQILQLRHGALPPRRLTLWSWKRR
jgi:hypothetical protein